MNETFNFKRFATYFKYDLMQMWRNHSKAAILIGGSSALFYILWVMFSLVFTQEWHSPSIAARVIVFFLAFGILELYMVRIYGHLTDKKAGSSWLMIPASRAEKSVSMLLITVVVIPVLFTVVYLVLDGFLSLRDPTFGQAIITGFATGYTEMLNGIAEINNQTSFPFNPSSLIFPSIVSLVSSFLYFLLCGICFKRNKLVGAIAILFLLSTVLSLVSGFVLPHVFESWSGADITEEMVMPIVQSVLNWSTAVAVIITIGLGWGVWYRVKTLQH